MNTKESINRAYSDAADDYAKKFWNDIAPKNLDCILLRWLAEQIPPEESILEIGSGPGEVSGYLSKYHGNCIGTDLSEQMILNAKNYYPNVRFEVQDFYNLRYDDNAFAAVVAFYAIVNLTKSQIRQVFNEVKRVLKPNGLFLFTFHLRKVRGVLRIRKFFSKDNKLSFYLYSTPEMTRITETAKLEIIDVITRNPYKELEFPTQRAYIVARKPILQETT